MLFTQLFNSLGGLVLLLSPLVLPNENSNSNVFLANVMLKVIDAVDEGESETDDELLIARPLETRVISPAMAARQTKIERCLQRFYTKHVNADKLRPWSIMHGVLAYGQRSKVVTQGHLVNAVDYLCANGIGHDRRILSLKDGKLTAGVGQGFQGHEGQLLAILAQVQTPIDHPIVVDGVKFTVQDLVDYEKSTCRAKTELTFKLIGLACYLSSDEMWKNDQGEGWNISRLINEEISQPINGAACGGIHRLMALSYTLEIRRARGEPIDGQWQRIASFTENYHRNALELQNPDGSFSSEFFEGISQTSDPLRQLYTTGHVLEWLAFSMSDAQLETPAVDRMVDFLIAGLESINSPSRELSGTDVGPTGHALRALRLYELRVFEKPSQHDLLASNETRPIATPTEVLELQPKIQAVLPSSLSNSGRPASPVSAPANRGGRFIRRR